MVFFKKPTANRFASLTDSLNGDPNLAEGLLSLVGSGAALLAKMDVDVAMLRVCVDGGTI